MVQLNPPIVLRLQVRLMAKVARPREDIQIIWRGEIWGFWNTICNCDLTKYTSDDEESLKEEDSDAEPSASGSANKKISNSRNSATVQKTISGRVTKKRASPRKSGKKDYKALDDPFVKMEDNADTETSEMIFETEKPDSEDSLASDGDYMKDAQAATVKMEEAI